MRYDAVLFDFDYTLGDATEAIYTGFVRGFAAMGRPAPDREAVRATIGMKVTEAYTLLTGDARTEEREKFYSVFHPVARDLQIQGMVDLFPGARELLESLKQAGAGVAIVSTKRAETLDATLKNLGLEELVGCVIGGGRAPTQKPAPEGAWMALEALGVDGRRALYCGDTVIDAETAQNAGLDFCAVLNGTTPAQAFADYPHVHIAPDLVELKAWLGI